MHILGGVFYEFMLYILIFNPSIICFSLNIILSQNREYLNIPVLYLDEIIYFLLVWLSFSMQNTFKTYKDMLTSQIYTAITHLQATIYCLKHRDCLPESSPFSFVPQWNILCNREKQSLKTDARSKALLLKILEWIFITWFINVKGFIMIHQPRIVCSIGLTSFPPIYQPHRLWYS